MGEKQAIGREASREKHSDREKVIESERHIVTLDTQCTLLTPLF